MDNKLGKVKSKFSWAKAIILFLSFLFIVSTLGVSLSLFRDNTTDEQSNDFAPIVLSDDSFNTLKSQVSVDMLGKSVLVQPVSFVVSKDTTSSVYVRALVTYESLANDARQKLSYESLTASTPVAGKSYKWTRFGQYYYLCDSLNRLVSLSSANSGEVFNLLEKESNIVPEDIIDEKFAGGEKVSLSVTLQSVQTSKVSSTNIERAHSAFNAVETSLANTKNSCSIYFYDANDVSLGSQTVSYGKGVNIPTPAAQSGKKLIGWNTKSDYTGATLDEEDLSSVYEDLVLYAEFDALTYNVTVVQPTDEAGHEIGIITPGSTTMRYGQSLTFRVIPSANYYIYGVYIENEETHQVKNIGSVTEFVVSGYTSDIKIWADISQEVIILDINGGTGSQPRITFNEDKTKFVLSETEPVGPNGKEFYYYSTNPLDNEEAQNGIRIDLGVEYPLSYLEDNKVLYAIYLTPTENYQTATNYIVVPKNVTAIEGQGEKNMFGVDTPDVKFVTLPRSVKKIGNDAFRNLDGLTGLSMSTVVDSIGNNAFENCVSIEQFVFGPFVNEIGTGAFKNCVSLSTLKNFENIPTTEFVGAFEGCTMLINVTLPSVTTKIEGAFKNCSNLIEVVLPNGLRNIGESAFENCTALSSINIPATVSFFGIKAFRNCVGLTEIVGLQNVVAVEIPDLMFENCISLKEINIPSNTAVIGSRAFNSCTSLERIINLSVVKVGEVCNEAFLNCTSLVELIFNGSLKTVGKRAFADSSVTKVTLSQRLSSLGERAFEDCFNLSVVQYLGVIERIGQCTFKNCSNLFSITIPSTVTIIETLAFENCSALASLNIPESVQTIGVDALKNATGLKSITLQGDLASSYNLASTKQNWYHNTIFVTALDTKGYYTTVVSDWIVTNINGNNYITGYRGNKKDVSIPYAITDERGVTTYIYGVALNQFTDSSFAGFENVVIEEGIQVIFNIQAENVTDKNVPINYTCFQGMGTLKSITLPTTLTSISYGAFFGCQNLEEVIGLENTKVTQLGVSIKTKKYSTILDYDDIIVINGNDYRIKYDSEVDSYGVFQLCYSLKSLKLPANLQIIGAYCFYGISVTELNIPASVRSIGAMAFCGMYNLETLSGLENCILDYKATLKGETIECGFVASTTIEGQEYFYPIFAELPRLKTLSLPSYATIKFGSKDSDGKSIYVPSIISKCPSLETIILMGDWPQAFSLATTEEDTTHGINSYKWYLKAKQVSTAMEAGTYSIFPSSDDSDWIVDENGMIIAYKGSSTTVTVPTSVMQDGVTVKVVGVKSFKNPVLVNVTLSEGLVKIDAGAFKDMARLKSVKLAKSVVEIGDRAFENCSNLVSIVLPEKTTIVGEDIFIGCSSIKIIVLNNNITTSQNLENISSGEWFYQYELSSGTTSEMQSKGIYSKYSSVATTNEWEVKAYNGQNYITAYLGSSQNITVPAVVVENDYSDIYEIYGLIALKKYNFISIVISEGIEAIGLKISNEDQLNQAYEYLGLINSETGAIDLPFMCMGEGSDLKYNDNLTTLIVPDSLDVAGVYGFAGVKLKGLNTTITLKNISFLGTYAFGKSQVETIEINCGNDVTKKLLTIESNAFGDSFAKSISIGYGPTLIEKRAFSGCASLVDLNLPASVVTIEDRAFDGCSSLETLNLRNARQIGSISECDKLSKIILGASLYSPYAASNITGKNGSTWFYEGGSDTAVTYFDMDGIYLAEKPDLSSIWTYEQINGKWYITGYLGDSVNLTVPSSLVIDGTETQIAGISSINTKEEVNVETLVISEGIAEILDGALSGKTKLSKITLPKSLTSIGANAFSQTAITLLTLACDSLTLSAGAFDGMDSLEIINVQNAVNTQYVLPTEASWTYISFDKNNNQSSSSSTTTLWNEGIYTTLANVATTIEWIVGKENDTYFIAGYKLDFTESSVVLKIPRLVINHQTFEVYEISSIKSLYLKALTNTEVKISLEISDGIEKIDSSNSKYSFTDVIGDSYSEIKQMIGGNGNVVSIELPSTLFEVGEYGFADIYELNNVINLENTQIKQLKQNTFTNNGKLTQLVFPASLKLIDSNNFSGCKALKKITLKNDLSEVFNLSNVGNGIWYYNTETTKTLVMQKTGTYSSSPKQNIGLWIVEIIDGENYITGYLGGATELVVPYELFDEQRGETVQIYGVRGIGKTDLVSISFDEGIENIGEEGVSSSIFGGTNDVCPYLEKITLPSSLKKLYPHALDGISATNIIITLFGSQKDKYDLSGIKEGTWYYGNKVTDSMDVLGSYTTFCVMDYMPDEMTFGFFAEEIQDILSNSETLESIINLTDEDIDSSNQLSESQKSTYKGFRDRLKSFRDNGEELTAIKLKNAWADAAGYGSIDYAWYLTDNESGGTEWTIYAYLGTKSELVIPRYVMDYSAFDGVPFLRELDSFYNIVRVDELSNDQEYTKITLQEGYKTFGRGDLKDSIDIPALSGTMSKVKEIVLPSTLTTIGKAAFVGFVSLEKINLEDTRLTSIPEYAFAYTTRLVKVVLPKTTKIVDMFAFYSSGLLELELNEGLVSLGSGALAGLTSLKVLTIPSTISSIQQNVMLYDVYGSGTETLSSLEKIIIAKDLSIALSTETITKNIFYKNGSQIALSTISEAGTYLSYLCGTSDDWQLETSGGKTYIKGYIGKNVVVDVPTYIWDRATGDTIDIYGVKSLNNSKIRKLTIREGVKSVGNGQVNIINGSYNNTLTYISLPNSLIENDDKILDNCFALESINLFGDLQTELETENIKPATWHSHNDYWNSSIASEGKKIDDTVKNNKINLAGGYSTYSIGENLVRAMPAQGGYGANVWAGKTGEGVDAFVPAFALYVPTNLSNYDGELTSLKQFAQLLKSLSLGEMNTAYFVPMNSVISLRELLGTGSSEAGTSISQYNKEIVFNSLTFAEGITRIGDKGNKNNGIGAMGSVLALGPVVNKANKVGSENKINLLPFDGSFENMSAVPSQIIQNGGTLSLSSTSYAGSKALSFSKSDASKATISTNLEAGVYVFEAMVKSSIAGAPLQVQLTSGSEYANYYSEEHGGDGSYQYVYSKFEVQSATSVSLNLIQSAIYDCMSLYRVDRGLPTTLTTLGANAFSMSDLKGYVTGLASINLSQTAIDEMEMYALNATFENTRYNEGLSDYQIVDGKYIVNDYPITYKVVEVDGSVEIICNFEGTQIKFQAADGAMTADGYTLDFDGSIFSTPDGRSYKIAAAYSNVFYISGYECVDWDFDAKTNILTFANTNIQMVESSEDMFWGEGYTFNAKTNRLTTPDGNVYTNRYFVQDGELRQDVVVAIPRTLTTLGFMALNTGATRYVGLEKSLLKSMEVGAFGGTIIEMFGDDTVMTSEKYGDNLVEINLPKTFEEVTFSTSSDLAVGSTFLYGSQAFDGGQTFHFPTEFDGYGFAGNLGLQNINVDPQNEIFTSVDGVLFNANQTTIISFPVGRKGDYVLPDTVTTIGEAAFITTSLSSVTVPVGLEEIKDNGFLGNTVSKQKNTALSEIIGLENSKLKTVGRGAFAGTLIRTLSFPETLVSMGGSNDAYVTPISGGIAGENVFLELIILRSALEKPVSLEANASENGWYYNFSSSVGSIQPAGIYSNKLYEREWKVEQIDGKWWIVAYLGDETSLAVPRTTINDAGDIIDIYGVKSLNYSKVTSLEVANGIKAFGYAGDLTNILGSTSDSKLAAIEIKGKLESMTTNSLMGLNELSCLTLATDLTEENSFAPTGKTTWYHYNNGTSEIVSTYQKAGIYTSSELQRVNQEWVVDSDGYIIAYIGSKTELVVPSHLLKENSYDVIIVKGIKSFKTSSYGSEATLNAVTSVAFSEGIKTIVDSTNGAFQYMKSLVEIKMSSTLNYIGENAFRDCDSLQEITVSSGVKEIAVSALPMDKNLRKVTLEGNLNTIFEIPDEYGAWFYNNEPTPTETIFIQGVYSKLLYSIVYEGNGAAMADGRTSYSQDNLLQGQVVNFAQNAFISPTSALFLGWSTDAKALYGEYEEGQEFILENTEKIETSDWKIKLYAIWQRTINILKLNNDLADSLDPDRGYPAVKFGNTTLISSDVTIDLSKEIILTGSFKLSTLGNSTRLISLMNGSYGIELYLNSSNHIDLRQNGKVVLTSDNAISANTGYSYFIYKSYKTTQIIILDQNYAFTKDGKAFFESSTESSSMTGTVANYVLGYANNSVAVTYGTAMVFESDILKLEYLPIENSGTTMLKIVEDRTESTVSLSNSSGSSASSINVVKMIPTSENSILPKENKPDRFGYVFDGYISDLNTEVYDENMKIKLSPYPYVGDKTLTAQWKEKDITIKWDGNGGTGSENDTTVYFDKPFTTSSGKGFYLVGHTLSKWRTDGWDQDFGLDKEYEAFSFIKAGWNRSDPSYELTFYAQWIANKYTVTFNPNANNGQVSPTSKEVTYGSSYGDLPTPTRTGYIFEGWYGGKNFVNNNFGQNGWSGSWQLLDINTSKYQFTVHTGGATGSAWRSFYIDMSAFANKNVTISGNLISVVGTNANVLYIDAGQGHTGSYPYHISGSSDSKKIFNEGDSTPVKFTHTCNIISETSIMGVCAWVSVTAAGGYVDFIIDNLQIEACDVATEFEPANKSVTSSTIVTAASDHTLYAKWRPITYTIAYNGNGNTSGSTASSTHTYDEAKNLTANGFVKTGYTFAGWSTSSGGSVNYSDKQRVINLSSTQDAVVTLYAKWTANTYNVTANANGGTIPTTSGWTVASGGATATKNVTFDKTYGTLPTPTKTGFTFVGWAGKNLFNKSATAFSTGHYISGNGSTTSYTAYNIYQVSVPAGATITIKNSGASSAPGYAFYTTFGKYISGANFSNKATVTVTVPSNATYIRVSVNMGGESGNDPNYRKDIDYFQIEIGSSATAYESYQLITSSTVVKTPNNHIITAVWAAKTYTVSIDENNKTGSTVTTKTITYGNTYGSFGSPTKTGYTLDGFRVGKRLIDETTFNGSSTYINLGRTYMYTDRISIMARAYMSDWTTYQDMRIISCTENGGWNLEPSGNYIQFVVYDSGVGYKAAKSKIAFADLGSGWHTFLATFDGNYARLYIDGRLVGTSDKFSSGKIGYNTTNSILVGAEVGSSNTAVGSYFNGRISYVSIINSVANTDASTTLCPAYDTVAVACWTPITYTIAYNGNGSTSGSTASSSHTYDEAKALTANGFAKTGYTFAGWATSSSGSVAYGDKASVINLSSTKGATVTLHAKWTANTYNVTFHDVLGKLSTGSVDGSTWSVSNGEYVMTSAGGNGGYLSGFSNFMTNGMNYRISVQAKASKAITLPMNYEAGTSKSISLTTSYQTFFVDFTYKSSAQYKALTFYSSSWASGDKLYVKDVQLAKRVEYDSTYGTLPAPTKTGYTFGGWYTSPNGFTLLEYIQSSGTQYIDTGLTMEKSTTMRMEISAQLTSNDNWAGVNGYMQYQAKLGAGHKGLFVVDYNGSTHIENVYFDGTVKYTQDWSSSYSESNNKVAVIGMGNKNNTWWTDTSANKNAQIGKWYYIKVYNAGTLVRDFVPVKRNSDNAIGLYDLVQCKFYANAGTGNFTAGTALKTSTKVDSGTKMTTASDHTLYALWTANTYVVTFNPNGGTYLSKTSLTIAASETGNWNFQNVSSGVFAPNTTYVLNIGTATRTAGSATTFQVRIYDFTTSAERATATVAFGNNVSITLKTKSNLVPANNNQIIIYAGVAGSTAGVAATFNNISLTVTKTVTYDSTYGDLPNPTRAGYTFAGWFTATSGGNQITASTKVAITAAQTLYARWTGIQYTLTFSQNGGNGGGLSATKYNTSPSNQTITVTEPTRNGWTRTSWTFTGHTGTDPTISGTTLTIPANTYGNITVTPVWTGKTYKISFDNNGGTGGKVSKTSYTVSASSQTVTITAPTRTGYDLSYSVSGNTGDASISGTTLTIAENTYGNITVKANWTVKSFTLTYSGYATNSVYRSSSPLKGASTGFITSGTTLYYNDVLKIYQKNNFYWNMYGGSTSSNTTYFTLENQLKDTSGEKKVITVTTNVNLRTSRNYQWRETFSGNATLQVYQGQDTSMYWSFRNKAHAGMYPPIVLSETQISGYIKYGSGTAIDKGDRKDINNHTCSSEWSDRWKHASWWATIRVRFTTNTVILKFDNNGSTYYAKLWVQKVKQYF